MTGAEERRRSAAPHVRGNCGVALLRRVGVPACRQAGKVAQAVSEWKWQKGYLKFRGQTDKLNFEFKSTQLKIPQKPQKALILGKTTQ